MPLAAILAWQTHKKVQGFILGPKMGVSKGIFLNNTNSHRNARWAKMTGLGTAAAFMYAITCIVKVKYPQICLWCCQSKTTYLGCMLLLAVTNVTAHPSTASAPTSHHSTWDYTC